MLKVTLAGYNIDSSLIRSLDQASATPEVISAAYARISRSAKSVSELRAEALADVAQARKSNQAIVFDLGHASVAEHAVFNFDVIGVSRLLTESLETLRFASFTEKSQRYVTFARDYVIPAELELPAHSALRREYISVMDALFAEYQASYAALKSLYASDFPDLPARARDGMAKEDARYILPLATTTQLGMTLNARSLENLLRRLIASPLREARELHAALLKPAREVCPSLVRHVEAEPFTGSFRALNPKIPRDDFQDEELVRLLTHTPNADDTILAALLYEQTQGSWQQCLDATSGFAAKVKQDMWAQVFADIRPWTKMPRAFELVDFSFELSLTESCWAQFKRHRVGSVIRQKHPSSRLWVLPEVIGEAGRSSQWHDLLPRVMDLKKALASISDELACYARLNADRVKVLVKMNLRELYHLIRLRCDEHAQWEINILAHAIAEQLRGVAPQATDWLCGKSEFADRAPTPVRQND
ncbi:MAG TPA: FAD-dependent thymidylate synthase [Candidatus Syntrophosphaera sp.]|nr:FAD-dependent thymidylate synthase [Candidatus Syntrophosphaera sp.]